MCTHTRPHNPVEHALLLFFFCVIGMATGCATVPQASPDDDALAKQHVAAQDRSLIYLYRNEIFGAAIPMQVSIDGQTAGKTVAYSYFLWDVPPGVHTITSYGEKDFTLTITTKAGEIHYVRQEIKAGFWTFRSKLYEVNEDEGRKAIKACKLIPSAVYDAVQETRVAKGGETQTAAFLSSTTPSKQGEEPTLAELKRQASVPEEIPKVIQRQGYTLTYEPVVNQLMKGDLVSALVHADRLCKRTQVAAGPKQDRYLTLLERGKVALSAGHYDQSIADLQEAERRFLQIEGTIPIVEKFGSLLLDDTTMEYEAEIHEKLMISPYLLLAYLAKGDFDGARVERNRIITKIHQYIEENPEERSYLENPFARYLTALMYEMEDKMDDAKIEYRKLKWNAEVLRIESKKEKTTDLVILIEVGLSPQKYQKKWGPQLIPTPDGFISLGFAYAGYAPIPTETRRTSIYLNEKFIGEANLLYDLDKTVLTQYEKNKPILEAKIVARMTTKVLTQISAKMAANEALKNVPFAALVANIVIDKAAATWFANEQADLRSWLSLPKQIKYLRIDGIEPGEHTVKIDFGCGVETKQVMVQKNRINVIHITYAK